jgi:hypothetical protein
MNFDERSFANSVLFYRDELWRVIEGDNPIDHFSRQKVIKLRKKGILTIKEYIPEDYVWGVTERALKVLENAENDRS